MALDPKDPFAIFNGMAGTVEALFKVVVVTASGDSANVQQSVSVSIHTQVGTTLNQLLPEVLKKAQLKQSAAELVLDSIHQFHKRFGMDVVKDPGDSVEDGGVYELKYRLLQAAIPMPTANIAFNPFGVPPPPPMPMVNPITFAQGVPSPPPVYSSTVYSSIAEAEQAAQWKLKQSGKFQQPHQQRPQVQSPVNAHGNKKESSFSAGGKGPSGSGAQPTKPPQKQMAKMDLGGQKQQQKKDSNAERVHFFSAPPSREVHFAIVFQNPTNITSPIWEKNERKVASGGLTWIVTSCLLDNAKMQELLKTGLAHPAFATQTIYQRNQNSGTRKLLEIAIRCDLQPPAHTAKTHVRLMVERDRASATFSPAVAREHTFSAQKPCVKFYLESDILLDTENAFLVGSGRTLTAHVTIRH